ncbi:MAG: hypothetical protein QXO37_08020 [Candidatus Nitrosocaldaceae archaeon]
MQFNFLTSLIVFVVILLPLFIFLIYRVKTYKIYGKYKVISLTSNNILLLLIILIIITIISSAVSIIEGKLHILHIAVIASTVNFLVITLFTNISSNTQTKIYLGTIIVIVIIYTLTSSAINYFYPYYRDNVRDTLAVDQIINSGLIHGAQELLKNTERYYSTLPIFQLLLAYLTSIIGNINFAYLLIGVIQLLGIILGTFILLKVINKKNINNYEIYDNKYLIQSVPFIGSLLIIGLPYAFFTITATQPQSISLLLAIIILYLFINLINRKTKSVIIIFAIIVAVANIYHVIMSIILFIFVIGYMIDSYNKRNNKISVSYISSIVIFAFLLIAIYWYEPSSILRINIQFDRIVNALQTTSITTAVTTSAEYLSEGFKFYAYAFAFILVPIIGLLCMWILNKTKIIIIHNIYIFSSFNITIAILIVISTILAFVSVMANPFQTGGLGRYLLGQGAIFILSLIVVSAILANIMIINKKVFVLLLCSLFIYTTSGLTQFYWTPDYNTSVYATFSNFINISTFYSNIEKVDIVYLHGSIYIPSESQTSLQQYKSRSYYRDVSVQLFEHANDKLDLQSYLLKRHNIGSDQSLLIFVPNEIRKNELTYSENFNRIFTSNRYSGFSTSLIMVENK